MIRAGRHIPPSGATERERRVAKTEKPAAASVRPSTPVMVLKGPRSGAAAKFFSERNFQNITTVKITDLPLGPEREVVEGTRTIIYSGHSAFTSDSSESQRKILVEIQGPERLKPTRVYKIKNETETPEPAGARYKMADALAAMIVGAARDLRAKDATVGTPERPFRIFIGSCFAGEETVPYGAIHDHVSAAMTEERWSHEVYASTGDYDAEGEKSKFLARARSGQQILTSLLGRKNPPPAYSWSARVQTFADPPEASAAERVRPAAKSKTRFPSLASAAPEAGASRPGRTAAAGASTVAPSLPTLARAASRSDTANPFGRTNPVTGERGILGGASDSSETGPAPAASSEAGEL